MSIPTTSTPTMATATTEDGMVVENPDGETAEAKVASGDSL